MEFVHLHNHSEYSFRDGMMQVSSRNREKSSEFFNTVLAQPMRAFAVTDHDNMLGAIDFYLAAKNAGVQPIIGCEIHEQHGHHHNSQKLKTAGHLTVIAKDYSGYRDMGRMLEAATHNKSENSPNIDLEMLEKYGKGFVVLSGCMHSYFAQACLRKDLMEAERLAAQYRDILGSGNFYLEIMYHGLQEEKIVLGATLEVAKRTGIPLVATNNCHYAKKDDGTAHDILRCMAEGRSLKDDFRAGGMPHEYYVKSDEEMEQLFSFCPNAIKNSVKIADKCRIEIPNRNHQLPKWTRPAKAGTGSSIAYLRHKALIGLRNKLGTDTPPTTYHARLDLELAVIAKKKAEGYFLITEEIISSARHAGIQVGAGAGTSTGSLVCYALDITQIDPLLNGLFFERFISNYNDQLPYLSVNFADDRIELLLAVLRSKYGTDNAAKIMCYKDAAYDESARCRLAKDVAMSLGVAPSKMSQIRQMIRHHDTGITIKSSPKTRVLLETYGKLKQLIPSPCSMPAGVVLAWNAFEKYAPAYIDVAGEFILPHNNHISRKFVGWEIDCTKLHALSIIGRTLENISRMENIRLDMGSIPLQHEKTFRALQDGDMARVFLFENRAFSALAKRAQPNNLNEIASIFALSRPGCRNDGLMDEYIKRGTIQNKTRCPYPVLEPFLGETRDMLIYQEQIMHIACTLAGFSVAQADALQRALGKKAFEKMELFRTIFVSGVKTHGRTEQLACNIFDFMVQNGGYCFSKAHALAYALLAYQTAYLKVNYREEFNRSVK